MAGVKTRILLRSDIVANWVEHDPVLLKGEMAICYDPSLTGERKIRIKVGDGTSKWSVLPYIADYDAVVAALQADITRLDGADTVDGSVAKKIKVAIDTLSADIAATYQTKLPEVTVDKYNKYLHTNTTTGELEWVYVEQGAANWGSISGSIDAQTDLMAEFAKKVDVEEGKGLSSNDYTDAEKEKLADIEEGAQVNVIEVVKLDGVALEVSNKSVNIIGLAKAADLETLEGKVEALESSLANYYKKSEVDSIVSGLNTEIAKKANSSDVYTKTEVDTILLDKADVGDSYLKTETYTKTEVNTELAKKQDVLGFEGEYNKDTNKVVTKSFLEGEIAKIKQFKYQVVDELPEPSEECLGIIYLVPKVGKTGYVEWICLDLGEGVEPRYKFEEIGDTDIDLSQYRKAAEQDVIDNEIKGRLNVIEGEDTVDGSIKKALKDAKAYADTLNADMDERVDDLEESVSVLEEKPAFGIKEADITAWNGEIGAKAAVEAEVTRAENAEEALGVQLNGLETRVETAEGEIDALQADSHTHENKDELDLINSGDVAKWNAKQDAISVGDNLKFTNNKVELDFTVIDCGSASDWTD